MKSVSFSLMTLLGLCLLAGGPTLADVQRWYIEAEECQGLQRYPYHNEDAAGWYAREANVRYYGAPGRSYFAAIHENAANKSMAQSPGKPIPAGKYKASLRIVGPAETEDSAVDVTIGATQTRFLWRHRGKRAGWLPFQEITLEQPAERVAFTAVQFGGSNHGALYMPLNKTLWLDTLYLTSDLAEAAPPDIGAERLLRAGVNPQSVPERRPHASDETGPNLPQTPPPVAPVVDTPIFLESFDGRRNLWPNSSFELGMNDGWATDSARNVFTEADLIKENPFHGAYCLKVVGEPFGRPYRLEKGGKMTFSVYVRGDGQKVSASLRKMPGRGDPGFVRREDKHAVVMTASGEAGAQWTRLVATGELGPGWYYLAFGGGDCLADAAQLEYGEQATEYAPRAEIEGALRTGKLANIIYEPEQTTLDLWLHNSGKAARAASLSYRIVDVRERVVAEGATPPVELVAGQTFSRPVAILPKLRGMFAVSFVADGRKGTDGETIFLVMPRPSDGPTRHQLGGNMNPGAEWEVAVHSRLGLKWALTCKSRQFASASEGAHPEPGVWKWHDADAALPAKHGVLLQPALWPGRIPAFMQEAPSRRYRSVRGYQGPAPFQPKIDLWKEHVSKVVSHYKDQIQWWCVDDEVEGAWEPSMLAPILEATLDAAHVAFPEVKVGYSGWVDFQEEMLHFIPVEKLDFFGSSTFDLNYWEARKTRHFAQRHGKPFFCYGVGGRPPMHTMYHTLYHFLPPYPKAARMAQRVINLLLIQDVTCAGHYAAVLKNYGTHYALNKPLCDYDGTPLPWGGTFGCLGTLLADATPVDHLPLGNTDHLAHLFRVGERFGFTTYATCVRDCDHHYRPAEREIKGMAFPCPEGSVEPLDMYWNAHPSARWEGDALRIDLNEEPVFFLDRGLGEDGLRRMIAGAKRPHPDCETKMEFVPAQGRQGVDVRITLRNNTDREIRDAFIDTRHNQPPFTVSAEWLLKTPSASLGNVPPGVEKSVLMPTVLDGQAPFEDGRMRVNLYSTSGLGAASDHALWLVPAPRAQAPVIDGKLDEWGNRPAAWLAYVWTSMPMGRFQAQFYDKAEHFSYPSYRLDARAMFWTGSDDENLYLAVRLEDDQPILVAERGERLRVGLRKEGKRAEIELRPLSDGRVAISLPSGAGEQARARCSQVSETIHQGADFKPSEIRPVLVEAAIPWTLLGGAAKPGEVLGFDLFWTDVDEEDGAPVEGTLRWAGRSDTTGYLLVIAK